GGPRDGTPARAARALRRPRRPGVVPTCARHHRRAGAHRHRAPAHCRTDLLRQGGRDHARHRRCAAVGRQRAAAVGGPQPAVRTPRRDQRLRTHPRAADPETGGGVMADRARHPPPDLGGPDIAPEALGFFELLRRLETGDRRFGRAGLPADEPARLGQRVRMSVATRDVAAFRPGEGDRPASVDVEVLGLLGPEGALPLHLTRWVMERLSDRWFAGDEARETADTAFLDFCNMLQHRMIALYWRAWGDARPEVQAEQGAAGRAGALLATLAGSGLPGMSRQATASA